MLRTIMYLWMMGLATDLSVRCPYTVIAVMGLFVQMFVLYELLNLTFGGKLWKDRLWGV